MPIPVDIDPPIIYGLDKQCRTLTRTASNDDNASRFAVGTQSAKGDNYIYLFEYTDDNNSLTKASIKFPFGELWHLSASDKYPNLITAVVGRGKTLEVKLLKLPKQLQNSIEDDIDLADEDQVEQIFNLVSTENESFYENHITRECHWHPDDGSQLLTCTNDILNLWDINKKQKILDFPLLETLTASKKVSDSKLPHHVTDLRWSSMFNSSIVAAVVGPDIYGVDTRIPPTSLASNCWHIKDEQCSQVLTADFNPNSQYYLASGGDDCQANFWDLRNTSSPALHINCHSHWLWNIRYNPFHDQFILSSSSDARVALMRIPSIASESCGNLINEDDEDENRLDSAEEDKNCAENEDELDCTGGDNKIIKYERQPELLSDEVLNAFEDHDDSVYCVEWSTDPWIFASLGYESRLVINKVPRSEKFNALF